MTSLKQKVYDWKDRLKDRHMLTMIVPYDKMKKCCNM